MLQSQIHKRINFNFDKQKLIFDTSQELFSFAKVDEGTKELLNSLRKNQNLNYKKVLDLGCGYGAIGIFIKNKFKDSNVLCTDRDSLAIGFTKHNAELNSVKVESISSLDFHEINGKFSLILTNFPAKLEKQGLEYFISKSSEYLEKNGTLVLVIVKELNAPMEEILSNEKIIVSFKERSKNYFIYHLKFNEIIKTEIEPYYSNELEYAVDDISYKVKTTNSLQEFDTPHYVTRLLSELISNYTKKEKVTIINPNQGFISLAVLKFLSPRNITLSTQDLLSLKISKENLELNNFSDVYIENSDFTQSKGDLLIWSLHDEGTIEILEKLVVFNKNFKKIILGGRIQVINRVLQNLKLESKKILKQEKYCAVEL